MSYCFFLLLFERVGLPLFRLLVVCMFFRCVCVCVSAFFFVFLFIVLLLVFCIRMQHTLETKKRNEMKRFHLVHLVQFLSGPRTNLHYPWNKCSLKGSNQILFFLLLTDGDQKGKKKKKSVAYLWHMKLLILPSQLFLSAWKATLHSEGHAHLLHLCLAWKKREAAFLFSSRSVPPLNHSVAEMSQLQL